MTEFPAGDAEETERVDEKRDMTPNRLATLSLKLGVLAFVGFFLFGFSVLTLADMLSFVPWGFGILPGWLSLIIFFLFSAVPAIILGHVALFKIWRSAVPMAGCRRAVAGLLLGYIYVFLTPLAADALKFYFYDHCSSNESSAVGNLRTIVHAQMAYRAAHGIYTGSFAELTDDTKGAALLYGQWDEDIPKNGYLFTLRSTENGNSYEAAASPVEPEGFNKYWFIDSSGEVRQNINAPADSSSPVAGSESLWREWWRVRRNRHAFLEQQP